MSLLIAWSNGFFCHVGRAFVMGFYRKFIVFLLEAKWGLLMGFFKILIGLFIAFLLFFYSSFYRFPPVLSFLWLCACLSCHREEANPKS